MKKRSSPIALIVVLVLCFTVVGYMNIKQSPTDPKDAQQQPQAPAQQPNTPPALGSSHPAMDKQSLASTVHVDAPTHASPLKPAASMGGPGGPGGMRGRPGRPGGPGGPGGMGNMPHLPPNFKPPKPKPSESMTAGEWYTSESTQDLTPPK